VLCVVPERREVEIWCSTEVGRRKGKNGEKNELEFLISVRVKGVY